MTKHHRPEAAASRRVVLRALASSAGALALGGCATFAAGSRFDASRISVAPTLLVATTRKAVNGGRAKPWYGSERGPLALARAKLMSPSDDRFSFSAMGMGDWAIESVEPIRGQVGDLLAQAQVRDILVYIHGFRNTFEDSVLDAVRLSDGVTIASAATEADENYGRLSPDGKLLAYEYQQAGEANVFVRTFPSGTGIWQVSTGGGTSPVWSRDGKQLYYLTDRDLVASAISTSGGFSAGPPRAIMPRTLAAPDNAVKFDFAQIASDGRVLAALRRANGAGAPYRLVLNWNR